MNQAKKVYQTEKHLSPDDHLSTAQKLFWGIFWGTLIGGSWIAADFIRPLFNALVWGM